MALFVFKILYSLDQWFSKFFLLATQLKKIVDPVGAECWGEGCGVGLGMRGLGCRRGLQVGGALGRGLGCGLTLGGSWSAALQGC